MQFLHYVQKINFTKNVFTDTGTLQNINNKFTSSGNLYFVYKRIAFATCFRLP